MSTTSDGDEEREYRVLRRKVGASDDAWELLITRRGQGRPIRTPRAARGLVTRESKSFWNREHEFKIQWRPVTTEWNDL